MKAIGINEEFLHHVWKFRLFNAQHLKTVCGQRIHIQTTGMHNMNAGPDFFNAKIKIGDTLWAGNVEIHVNSSDWLLHKHSKDKAYANVILHVVYEHTAEVKDAAGNNIPVLELKSRIEPSLIKKYDTLYRAANWIPCSGQVNKIASEKIRVWLMRLAIERLERKTEDTQERAKQLKNDWNEAFYITLARNFGLKVNAEPFEMLAATVPQKLIAKNKNNPDIVSAMLFGQSGLLDSVKKEDEYVQALRNNYTFLQKKYKLVPLPTGIWKFARLRPANFPTVRIAQLAALCSHSSGLFSKLMHCQTVAEAKKLLSATPGKYWAEHYQFGEKVKRKNAGIGEVAINNLLINTVIPFLFAYGRKHADTHMEEKAIHWLELVKAENNSIINRWAAEGIKVKNAMETQALLELKNEYCSKRKCIHCALGIEILKT